jgi:hypothetical protein
MLITGTGGFIDPNGDALGFNSTVGQPLGTVTIEAGALVFGDGNGIDFTAYGAPGQFLIDGTVEGNFIGMNLTNGSSGAVGANITIGTQGSVSGDNTAISFDTYNGTITNNGLISSTGTGIYTGGVNVSVTNTGTIDGGLLLDQSGFVVVNDSGTIDSQSGGAIFVGGGTSADLTVNGSIMGFIWGIYSDATSATLVEGPQGMISAINAGVQLWSQTNATVDGGVEGDLDGIDVFGSGSVVSIGESGSVSGANGAGIDVAAVTERIDNAGTIKGATGILASPSNTGSAPSAITLVNTGTILGGINLAASSYDTITNTHGTIGGVVTLGQYDTMANSGGTIGSGIVLAYGDTVTNSGTIDGGIQGNGGESIQNAGTITGGIADSNAATDTIDNMGRIFGTIDQQSSHLTNSGTIHGLVYFGAQSTLDNSGTIAGKVTFAGSDDIVTNSGTIHSLVTLGTGDSFVNSGAINGGLDLGANDTLDTSTGSVTGHIVASTSDTFDFSGSFGKYEISGFVAAVGHPTTFDVIDFASDDFSSYTELQSHMAQVGKDVVITLDANDDIVLVGTKLAYLNTHDFLFT